MEVRQRQREVRRVRVKRDGVDQVGRGAELSRVGASGPGKGELCGECEWGRLTSSSAFAPADDLAHWGLRTPHTHLAEAGENPLRWLPAGLWPGGPGPWEAV